VAALREPQRRHRDDELEAVQALAAEPALRWVVHKVRLSRGLFAELRFCVFAAELSPVPIGGYLTSILMRAEEIPGCAKSHGWHIGLAVLML
jgi:hypothetical protein